MGADVFKEIREFVEGLGGFGIPPGIAMKIEAELTDLAIRFGREKRAAEAMPKLGAARAAQIEGCSRQTIYNRARRYLRKSKSSAESCT